MKLFSITLLLTWASTMSCFSQDTLNHNLKDSILFLPDIDFAHDPASYISIWFECPFNQKSAQNDIESNSLKIVLEGGFTGFGYLDETRMESFEKKYGVQFILVGCIRSWDPKTEDIEGYNSIIFAHLKKKYGNSILNDYQKIFSD